MRDMGTTEYTDECRPLSELRDTGMLWLINRVVFHPRGFALALHVTEDGSVTGWRLLGDGREVWTFKAEDEDELFAKSLALLTPAPEDA